MTSAKKTDRHQKHPVINSPRCVRMICAVSLASWLPAKAALLPTEIHYNGPGAGTDPDEFLELTNTGPDALSLAGYRFDVGIDFTFPATSGLAAYESLVLARDTTDFLSVFPGFSGPLFDFSGALSNSGETIGLLDSGGALLWSFAYDDSGAWPSAADGGGLSLQLLGPELALSSPGSWEAAAPTPGLWPALELPDPTPGNPGGTAVSQPASALLLLAGLPFLRRGGSARSTSSQGRSPIAPGLRLQHRSSLAPRVFSAGP